MNRAFSKFLATAVATVLIGLCGCGQKTPPAAPATQSTPTQAAAKPIANSVSQEEGQAFAEQFEQAIVQQNAAIYNQAIDWESVADRSMAGLTTPKAAEIRTGMVRGFTQTNNLLAQVSNLTAQGGSYKLLRVHQVDGQTRALFRLLLPVAGVNYHDIPLVRGAGGQVQGADIYIFMTSEYLSETVRRTLYNVLPATDPGILDRLTGRDRDWLAAAKDFERMTAAIQSGQPQEALRIYHTLPQTLQNDKTCLALRIQAATQAADEREHLQAFSKLRTDYPDDPSLPFMSIDYHTIRKNYDDTLKAIDQLDKQVEGDPYLDVMRANLHLLAGRLEDARRLAKAALEAEPLLPAHWVLVTISLKEKNYDDTLRLLIGIDRSFKLQWSDLSNEPEYAGFVASPQYQDWLEYLEK